MARTRYLLIKWWCSLCTRSTRWVGFVSC